MQSRIRNLLETAGFASTDLEQAPGFANAVWLTPDAVIRVNEGRFRDAFRYEASVLVHLKSTFPVPEVLAVGQQDGGGEFIILRRLPGRNLEEAWPTLTASVQDDVCRQLGRHIEELHSIPAAAWMRNPWVELALDQRQLQNAYHAPPADIDWMIEAARQTRPDLTQVLEQVGSMVRNGLSLFQQPDSVFVHADLHFRNVMVMDGQVTGLIDFEGARLAPRDTELDMLVRWLIGQRMKFGSQYDRVVPLIRNIYPALFAGDNLIQRMEIYELLWQLVQLQNWKPGATWMNDPGDHLQGVLSGRFGRDVATVLS
ncbi:MAG: phosphotransferase [Thermomicrobiales bacterium]